MGGMGRVAADEGDETIRVDSVTKRYPAGTMAGQEYALLAVVDDTIGSVAGTNLQVLARQRNFSCGVA
jgi:hypothetical protein